MKQTTSTIADFKENTFPLRLIVSIALLSVTLLCIFALRYPTSQIPNDVLNFHFNPYVIPSLLGILCNAFLIAYINLPKLKTPEAPWFSLYLMMNIIWGVGEAATRLSTAPANAIFWWHLQAIGLGFAPCAFFLFTLAYIYQDNFVRYVLPVLAMITLGLIITYLFLATGVLVDKNPDHARLTPWGYYPAYPTTYVPFLGWLLAGYAGAQVLLITRFRRTREWPKVKLFLFGALIPLIIGLATDAILPAFGAFFPPSAVIATALFAAIVAYTTAHYGLLRLNHRTFAPGLIQTMSEGVIVTDPKLRIEFFNNGAVSLLGNLHSQSHTVTNLRHLLSPAQSKQLMQQVISPLKQQDITRYDDAEIQSLSGESIPIRISATKVLDAQNRLTGYSFVLTDLRQIKAAAHQLELEKQSVERKVMERTAELEHARSELEASVRSLPFGFAIINEHDEITFSNSQLHKLTGHRLSHASDPSSLSLKQMCIQYKPSIDILDCIHQSQVTGTPIEENISHGSHFYRFFFMPIFGHGKQAHQSLGSVLLMEDTTEAKALERSRDEFFSIASHELRTPLTAIRGNANMMLEYYKEQLKDPDLHMMVEDMHASSLRLIAIVNDFLDMSRLEQGKFTFNNVSIDIIDLLKQIMREYEANGSSKHLDLTLNAPNKPIIVTADADRTRQVLVNLIGNALKFTDSGGITIQPELTDGSIRILITDTGRGIPLESQHLLFRKFQQATGNILTRDDTRGTGLGLYISRLMAEGMGGKLEMVHSQVDKGTTFAFELPLTTTTNHTV